MPVKRKIVAKSTRKKVCIARNVQKFRFLNNSFVIVWLFIFSLTNSIYSQDNPQSIGIQAKIHRLDYFINFNYTYSIKQHSFRGGIDLGISTNIIQRTLASRNEIAYQYDIVKSEKWLFAPSFQYGLMYYPVIRQKNIHWYHDFQLGYFFSFGKKIRVTQSAYFGYLLERYKTVIPLGNAVLHSYAFQISIGMAYAF